MPILEPILTEQGHFWWADCNRLLKAVLTWVVWVV